MGSGIPTGPRAGSYLRTNVRFLSQLYFRQLRVSCVLKGRSKAHKHGLICSIPPPVDIPPVMHSVGLASVMQVAVSLTVPPTGEQFWAASSRSFSWHILKRVLTAVESHVEEQGLQPPHPDHSPSGGKAKT